MKQLLLVFSIILLFSSSRAIQGFAVVTSSDDTSGIVSVSGDNSSKNVRIKVQKGEESYVTPVLPTASSYDIPLIFGPGKYTVSKLDLVYQNVYRVRDKENFRVTSIDDLKLYSSPNIFVNYSMTDSPIEFYLGLVAGCNSSFDIVKTIYQDMITNYRYDHRKPSSVSASYCSDITETFTVKSGICHDFATLMAATLRSCNIPTKLVIGRCDNLEGVHAWNEVYIDGKWYVVDTTMDMGAPSPVMIKRAEEYHAIRVY